jgi:hypothetical protein
MRNLCNSFSMKLNSYKTKVYIRLSCKMSKFCSKICSTDDDEHESSPTQPEPVKFNNDVYTPTHPYSIPKEKIKVVELTLQQKLDNLKESGPDETPVVSPEVVIETPVVIPEVVIETPVVIPEVVIETPVGDPVDIINTDDDWSHISSDDDYSHVDEY